MNLPKTTLLLILIKLVTTQTFLFQSAFIRYKLIKSKPVQETFRRLATIDEEHFTNVTNIKIVTKKMRMYEGAVKNLPELKVLRLKDCGIRVLEKNCFQNLPKLERVHLQDNDLSIIGEGVFNYLPVEELRLQRNEIEVISPGAFDDMPNLRIIRLNHNFLTGWDGRWFRNTPNLRKLYFRRNFITFLPARAFANIKGKHRSKRNVAVDTQILLSTNNITEIDPEALQGIESLDLLDLENNLLDKIPWEMFSHMTDLTKLNLSRNHLTEIDGGAFDNLKMKKLDLSKNLLTCVPYEVVAKVEKVNLSKNKLECECFIDLMTRLRTDGSTNQIVAKNLECGEFGLI